MTIRHGGYPLWKSAYGERQAKIMSAFWRMLSSAVNYTPTAAQRSVIESEANPKLIIGGVRAGKSFTTSVLASPYLIVPGGRIWIVGSDYTQTAEFDYLLDFSRALGILSKEPSLPVRGSRSFSVAGGSTVQTKSADDLRRIASFSVDAFVAAEVGQMTDDIISKALERTIETGGSIILSGTLENGMPWLSEVYDEWENGKSGARSFSIPTWSNTSVFPEGIDDPKFKAMAAHLTEDEYQERFAARPRKRKGLCHPSFSTSMHVKYLPIDRDLPIQVFIDPGVRTYALLAAQIVGDKIHIVDEIYRNDVLTDEMVALLHAKPYYDRIERIIIDIAARQRHAQTSVWSQWAQKTNLPVVTKRVGVQDGIDAINRFLAPGDDGLPRLLISDKLSGRTVNGEPTGIRTEFQMRRWADAGFSRNEPHVPIKKWDHALNALGYGIFMNFRTEFVKPSSKLKRIRMFKNLGRTR